MFMSAVVDSTLDQLLRSARFDSHMGQCRVPMLTRSSTSFFRIFACKRISVQPRQRWFHQGL